MRLTFRLFNSFLQDFGVGDPPSHIEACLVPSRSRSIILGIFEVIIKKSGGERSDGKGREGEATGKSCIQDGERIDGGISYTGPRGCKNEKKSSVRSKIAMRI